MSESDFLKYINQAVFTSKVNNLDGFLEIIAMYDYWILVGANPEIQSETYKRGYTSIYVKDIKFPRDGNGPFQLVYVSPSFEMDAPGPLSGPLIYKVNKEYNPNQ